MLSMLAAFWVVAVGEIVPVGSPETIAWGKQTGYSVADAGVSVEITGPAKILAALAGDVALKGKKLDVELVRDDRFVSLNAVKMKPKRGGPKGLGLQAAIGFDVPEGKHTYRIKVTGGKTALSLAVAKQIPKPLRAAVETDISKGALPPAPAEPIEEPEAGTETAKAEPTSRPTLPAEVEAIEAHAAVAMAVGAEPVSAATGTGVTANLVQARRIAVYDLELQDIAPAVGSVVTDSLVTEIRKLQGVAVIGMDEIRDMLSHEANKQVLGCESNEACLAEIAGALGVDDLVTGSLSKAADGHVMVVRRIDQHNAKVVGAFNQRLNAGSGQEFLLAVGPAVEELFADRELREGLQRGVAEEVALRLDPPPLPTWAFYTAAGATLAAAALGGVFGLLADQSEGEFNRTARGSGIIEGSQLVDLEDSANGRALGANVAFATAGGLAITAGIMALFTDWYGYGSELER